MVKSETCRCQDTCLKIQDFDLNALDSDTARNTQDQDFVITCFCDLQPWYQLEDLIFFPKWQYPMTGLPTDLKSVSFAASRSHKTIQKRVGPSVQDP